METEKRKKSLGGKIIIIVLIAIAVYIGSKVVFLITKNVKKNKIENEAISYFIDKYHAKNAEIEINQRFRFEGDFCFMCGDEDFNYMTISYNNKEYIIYYHPKTKNFTSEINE